MGVLHLHLSGGEPCSRRDLAELVAHAVEVGLYTNLITSGVGLTRDLFARLAAAGLDHLQLSIQGVDAPQADWIGGYKGGYAKKREVAEWVTAEGLPLTVNAVIHRGKRRRRAAHGRSRGRTGRAPRRNRAYPILRLGAQEPRLSDADARADRARLRRRRSARVHYRGTVVIDHVAPDYHAKFPKACMNGWGRQTMNVSPSGKVLPCHSAEIVPGLEFWSARERPLADIWARSPAFEAFRGLDWMQEPCRSCERKAVDFGGCRCQAMALLGDAAACDPACTKSPHHALMAEIATADSAGPVDGFAPRRYAREPA